MKYFEAKDEQPRQTFALPGSSHSLEILVLVIVCKYLFNLFYNNSGAECQTSARPGSSLVGFQPQGHQVDRLTCVHLGLNFFM